MVSLLQLSCRLSKATSSMCGELCIPTSQYLTHVLGHLGSYFFKLLKGLLTARVSRNGYGSIQPRRPNPAHLRLCQAGPEASVPRVQRFSHQTSSTHSTLLEKTEMRIFMNMTSKDYCNEIISTMSVPLLPQKMMKPESFRGNWGCQLPRFRTSYLASFKVDTFANGSGAVFWSILATLLMMLAMHFQSTTSAANDEQEYVWSPHCHIASGVFIFSRVASLICRPHWTSNGLYYVAMGEAAAGTRSSCSAV